jgi:hypothetical protein
VPNYQFYGHDGHGNFELITSFRAANDSEAIIDINRIFVRPVEALAILSQGAKVGALGGSGLLLPHVA